MEHQKILLAALLVVCVIAPIMMPVLRYVWTGWHAKRKDIMDGLNAEARQAYFEMFVRSEPKPDLGTATPRFDELHERWYGRRYFLIPGLLLFAVSTVIVTLVVLTMLDRVGYISNPIFNVPEIAMAATTGAYLWVVHDLISRSRKLDFSSSDVQWGVLRLVVSVPMGYAFASIAAESVGPFIAFALGAFPLSALTAMLQRLAKRRMELDADDEKAGNDLIELQGINRTIVERLANEDVTTVLQLAYCDPVRLVMRSNLSFTFVTDCMNQAVAWTYLEKDLKVLRPLGTRGAIEIKHLVDAFDQTTFASPKEEADHNRAVAALPLLAAAIKQDPATLQVTFRQIAEDPYTEFLYAIWD